MKHVGIISIMEGYPWGGSELLWADMAEEALEHQYKVSISYKYWADTPDRLNELEMQGAKLFLREEKYLRHGLLKRLWNKIMRRPTLIQKENPFVVFFKNSPDVVLINEGAFGSILHFPQLYECLLEEQIPYVMLSHQNKEFGALPEQWIQKAKMIYSKAQKSLFVSQRNKEMAELMLCQRLNNSGIVRNPVNLSNTDIVPYPRKNEIRLACVGRLYCQQKGQDLLLRALSELADSYKFHLTFYGSGEDQSYLEDLTRFLKIEDKVSFAGFEKNVRSIWANDQLLVLSSHYEGMPIVIVEAMLCGRPCLVTDVAGHAEWIEDGMHGYICETPHVKAIKRSLIRAFSDHRRWEQMGEKAREQALQLFDEKSGNSLLTLILKEEC